MGVFVPAHEHVVYARADDTADNAADYGVDSSVGVESEALHSWKSVDKCKDKSECDDYSVPLDIKAEYRECGRINIEFPAKFGKLYFVWF